MISVVSDLTKYDFGKVYDMPAMEFFAYIQYINEKRRREYIEAKKEEARIRSMRRK